MDMEERLASLEGKIDEMSKRLDDFNLKFLRF